MNVSTVLLVEKDDRITSVLDGGVPCMVLGLRASLAVSSSLGAEGQAAWLRKLAVQAEELAEQVELAAGIEPLNTLNVVHVPLVRFTGGDAS